MTRKEKRLEEVEPMNETKLKSLSEHNHQTLEQYREFHTKGVPNGIACPECGSELRDVPGAQLLTAPPQLPVVCMACGYTGHRF